MKFIRKVLGFLLSDIAISLYMAISIVLSLLMLYILCTQPIGIFIVLAFCGWIFVVISIIIGTYRYYKLNAQLFYERECVLSDAQHYVQKAQEALDRAYGYNEEMAENVGFYSKMIGSGVSTPAVNAIVNFARDVKNDDSIFLLKLDNEKKIWHFQVAGRTIHVKMAEWILQSAKDKCIKVASHDGIIWKPKNIHN